MHLASTTQSWAEDPSKGHVCCRLLAERVAKGANALQCIASPAKEPVCAEKIPTFVFRRKIDVQTNDSSGSCAVQSTCCSTQQPRKTENDFAYVLEEAGQGESSTCRNCAQNALSNDWFQVTRRVYTAEKRWKTLPTYAGKQV